MKIPKNVLAKDLAKWYENRNREIYETFTSRKSKKDLTLHKLGTKYGLTRERVRQIVAREAKKIGKMGSNGR